MIKKIIEFKKYLVKINNGYKFKKYKYHYDDSNWDTSFSGI